MLKKEEQAISIMSFLVFNYRDARDHGGDYEPILGCLTEYHNGLKKVGKLSDDELQVLYLKAKIKAGEEQIKKYKSDIGSIHSKGDELGCIQSK